MSVDCTEGGIEGLTAMLVIESERKQGIFGVTLTGETRKALPLSQDKHVEHANIVRLQVADG
jgi:hypothetical protein